MAPLDPGDTIVAAATAPGHGARAIVRLSGGDAWSIALAGFEADGLPSRPRHAEIQRGSLRLPGLRPRLPAMVAFWPGPRTYTGQDVAEIHTVGSPPIVSLVVSHCLREGARHAQPGEFTLRAFLSGRLDLTRAEAVLGVIDARNPAQLDAALEQLAGGLSGPILGLRDRLLDLVAHLEANLDFVEEPDVDLLGATALAEELGSSADQLARLTERLQRRERTGTHPRVVLIGPPNTGKSRLFNTLLGNDRAIVSHVAGTTRDYLSARWECDGLTIELVDTAGIEASRDSIETQAQELRSVQARLADLLLVCRSCDGDEVPLTEPTPHPVPQLSVWTRSDLATPGSRARSSEIVTSVETGEGLPELRMAVARALRARVDEGDLPASTAARCRDSLMGAQDALRSASQTLLAGLGDELVALDLRLAIDELGKVVGAIVTDDILDRIFSRFCIGK